VFFLTCLVLIIFSYRILLSIPHRFLTVAAINMSITAHTWEVLAGQHTVPQADGCADTASLLSTDGPTNAWLDLDDIARLNLCEYIVPGKEEEEDLIE